MDLGFKRSTTFFTVFCKAEVFLKAENWDLNLKRKCPEDAHHGGKTLFMGEFVFPKNPTLSSSYALFS